MQFRELYEKVVNEQQLKMFTESKKKFQRDEYDIQCVASALRVQFVSQYDAEKVKNDILHNIDRSLKDVKPNPDYIDQDDSILMSTSKTVNEKMKV